MKTFISIITAMRSYVASKLGEEVEIPEEYEMTNEQQRKMLEYAAKACGKVIDKSFNPSFFNGSVIPYGQLVVINEQGGHSLWNPLTNPADTAEICAILHINTIFKEEGKAVSCWQRKIVPEYCEDIVVKHSADYIDHDNSRLKAWMHAATMVAAKTQGCESWK